MLMNEIRVLTVDDHHAIREGLATLVAIYDDLTLVGEARNGQEALNQCARVHPDVVLMDVIMPVMDGIEATQVIHARYPMVNVVAFTNAIDTATVEAAVDAGAVGCLLKTATIDEIADGIRAAARHQLVLELSHASASV